jgi:cellobiose-specific phosphotransferase system component IIC
MLRPTYDGDVLALSLEDAKNIAVAVSAVFVAGSVASAWIMKTIVQKVAVAGVLAILAFAVWTQRASLQDCADKVKSAYALDGVNPTLVDTDCSFFGTTITISDPRAPDVGDTDNDGQPTVTTE